MSKKPTMDKYVKAALKLDARDAKPISTSSVVTDQWVRMKCQYGCAGYGDRLTCPPYSPTPEQTAKMLKEYRRALLIQGSDHTDMTEIAANIEREAFLDGYYKAFGMGAGPCGLCSECRKKECRHPEQARPSMEACGIDVYQTAHNNGYPIEVVRDHVCEQNYYALVLIE